MLRELCVPHPQRRGFAHLGTYTVTEPAPAQPRLLDSLELSTIETVRASRVARGRGASSRSCGCWQWLLPGVYPQSGIGNESSIVHLPPFEHCERNSSAGSNPPFLRASESRDSRVSTRVSCALTRRSFLCFSFYCDAGRVYIRLYGFYSVRCTEGVRGARFRGEDLNRMRSEKISSSRQRGCTQHGYTEPSNREAPGQAARMIARELKWHPRSARRAAVAEFAMCMYHPQDRDDAWQIRY